MDRSALAKMYVDSVKNGKINSETLLKLPELITCKDWSKVDILGNVSYISDRTKVSYNGILVKYDGGLYYMKKNVAEALGNIEKRFKSVKAVITVI